MPPLLIPRRLLSTAHRTPASITSLDPKYQIFAACLLQRPPIIQKGMNVFEKEYEKYRLMLESETARGIFHVESPQQRGDEDVPMNSIGRHVKAVDGEQEDAGFVGGGGEGAGKAYEGLGLNDLRRELDRKLFLLVKENTSGQWKLPSKLLSDDSRSLSDVQARLASMIILNLLDGH
jgi:hypothetical protein